MPASHVLIALGSNLGDRDAFLDAATRHVGALEHTRILAESSRYRTAPAGGIADREFFNAALVVETQLDPCRLIRELQKIEDFLGRQRDVAWGNRTIDLDILLWRECGGRGRCIRGADLVVPHPRMLLREFVILPAAEIAPDWVHPTTGMTLREALSRLRRPWRPNARNADFSRRPSRAAEQTHLSSFSSPRQRPANSLSPYPEPPVLG